MPATITANLSNITAADPNNQNNRSATFSQGAGTPGWASVKSDGEIDANGQGAVAANVVFNLPADSPVSFKTEGPFSPSGTGYQFSVTSVTANSLTVLDNNAPGSGETEYTLYFSDGSKLDPKFINR